MKRVRQLAVIILCGVLSTGIADDGTLRSSSKHAGLSREQTATSRPATIIYLADGMPGRIHDLCRSLASLDRFFIESTKYPVTIFHPQVTKDPKTGDVHVSGNTNSNKYSVPLSNEQMIELQACTRARLTFATVDFESYVPRHLASPGKIPEKVHNFPVGYRHMCNFFAAPLAFHPELLRYRYYWRMDTDAELVEPLNFDVFKEMERRALRYAYVNDQCDWHVVMEGLFDVAKKTFGDAVAQRIHPSFADKSCNWDADMWGYNGRIYYNNFEVVDLEFLRSDAYQQFYKDISEDGGIFLRRWGDAPIRTIAVQALLPPDAIHKFTDISYHHQGYYGPVVLHLILTGVICASVLGIVMVYAWGDKMCGYLRCHAGDGSYRLLNAVRPLAVATTCNSLPRTGMQSGSRYRSPHWYDAFWDWLMATDATVEQRGSAAHMKERSGDEDGNNSSDHMAKQARYSNMAAVQFRHFSLLVGVVGFVLLAMSHVRYNLMPLPSWSPTTSGFCFTDDLLCLLKSSADDDGRVVVTTAQWDEVTEAERFASSLTQLGSQHYLVIALDAQSAFYLTDRNVAVYWNPAPISRMRDHSSAIPISPARRQLNALMEIGELGYKSVVLDPAAQLKANPLDMADVRAALCQSEPEDTRRGSACRAADVVFMPAVDSCVSYIDGEIDSAVDTDGRDGTLTAAERWRWWCSIPESAPATGSKFYKTSHQPASGEGSIVEKVGPSFHMPIWQPSGIINLCIVLEVAVLLRFGVQLAYAQCRK